MKIDSGGAATRRAVKQGRVVDPRPITGAESPVDVLKHAFPAYVGRQVRTAWELMARAMREDAAVFMTLSGAMTPAGLHRSCLVPMIQRGYVDVLTTTGANLYHDAHRVIGHTIREITPDQVADEQLREARIIRIYDLAFDEQVLLDTDLLFARLLRLPEFQKPMTTPETHYLLGKHLYALEQQLGAAEPCLLSACYQAGVPIFVGAPQDGSIFLNVVKLRALLGSEFQYRLDAAADVKAMAAVQWLAQRERQTAVWILGGGVPKNYTLQGEPTLSQIFGLDARGFDMDVQFCVDPVDNGALSSCPAGEGHTWGKVSAECVAESSIYVHCDLTAVFPWLTYALFFEGFQRPPRRLYDRLDEALAELDSAVEAEREGLLAELEGSAASGIRVGDAGERGRGVFATRTFRAGDVIMDFVGTTVEASEVENLDHYLQVGPTTFMGPSGGPDDLVNHSCDPCCGLRQVEHGRIELVALREIEAGEELFFDYSTWAAHRLWKMDCGGCGPRCRGHVGDFDELPEELQERYIALGVVPDFARKPVSS